METQESPPVGTTLPAAILLSLVGWGGLVGLWINTLPTLGPRWLFFFLVVVALSGTFLPVVAFLNRRFPTEPPVNHSTVLREAIFVGIYGSTVAWLQLGRALTPPMGLLIAVGLFFIEWMIRLRERSRWEP
jgi:hypothetical protein